LVFVFGGGAVRLGMGCEAGNFISLSKYQNPCNPLCDVHPSSSVHSLSKYQNPRNPLCDVHTSSSVHFLIKIVPESM